MPAQYAFQKCYSATRRRTPSSRQDDVLSPVFSQTDRLVNRRQLFSITFFSILLLLIWQLAVILSPFFYPIMWAVILAATFYPLYMKLLHVLGGRHHLGAVIMTLMVMAIAVLPAVYLIFLGINEAVQAYEIGRQWFREGRLQDLGMTISQLPLIGNLSQDLFHRVVLSNRGQLESSFLEGGKVVSAFLLSQGADFAKNAFHLCDGFSRHDLHALFSLSRRRSLCTTACIRPSRLIPIIRPRSLNG